MRLKALYEYVGIYFDTDVEVKKPFPEKLFDADLVLAICMSVPFLRLS